ncbi:MAG TPA: flagellin [Candidatus Ozemobacteraceae bacterium]|nr:flagellin [Candidatus Ozemobacteraceae bacterium]
MVELTLRDTSGNMRQVRTSSDRATGLLDGIDIQFKSQAAQMAGIGGLEAGLHFENAEQITFNVGGVFAVTASIAAGDWTLEGITRNINSFIFSAGQTLVGGGDPNGTEFANSLKATVVDGQIRVSWVPPVSVSSANGTIQISGASAATTIGFLNGTYSGFVQGTKNEAETVWGYSRYNDPSTNITAGTVVNLNLYDGNPALAPLAFALDATLGTAQAELQTADMKLFTEFQASINQALQAAGIEIRVDQVGSTMAFTSLRVGRENRDGQIPLESVVQLTVDDGVAGATAADRWLALRFGIEDGQSRGSGDANFQIHIVDNTPQFQIGADQGQSMKVSFTDMSAEALGVDKLDMTTVAGAQKALAKLNQAIDKVSAERSKLGAFQNRLEYAINNLRTTNTNLTSAESRLRDVDVSQEMIEFTRNQIINQSGMAMLAQANTLPQGVLQLLQ